MLDNRHSGTQLLAGLALCVLALVVAIVAGGATRAGQGGSAAGAELAVSPVRALAVVGDLFSVDIRLTAAGQPVQGVDAFLSFDHTCLQIVDASGQPATVIQAGPTLSQVIVNRVDNTTGKIDYCAGVPLGGQPVSGSLIVATIRFKCIAQPPAEGSAIAFAFDEAAGRLTLAGHQGQDVLNTHTDGLVSWASNRMQLPLVLKLARR